MENLKSPVTEAELAGKAVKPRVTVCDVEDAIAGEYYFTPAEAVESYAGEQIPTFPSMHIFTICVLVLQNGFIVTGESACADPENYNAEIGMRIARKNAVDKIWPLLGYQLKDKLHAEWNGEQV